MLLVISTKKKIVQIIIFSHFFSQEGAVMIKEKLGFLTKKKKEKLGLDQFGQFCWNHTLTRDIISVVFDQKKN